MKDLRNKVFFIPERYEVPV